LPTKKSERSCGIKLFSASEKQYYKNSDLQKSNQGEFWANFKKTADKTGKATIEQTKIIRQNSNKKVFKPNFFH